jgi:hypothetical protein
MAPEPGSDAERAAYEAERAAYEAVRRGDAESRESYFRAKETTVDAANAYVFDPALVRAQDDRRLRSAQSDPNGLDPGTPGAKLDAGKPLTGSVLLDFRTALAAVADVGTYGARKYSLHGWLCVPDAEVRYTDAMFRHLLADGETDVESGLRHLAHAAWNALAVLELKLRGVTGE